MVFLREIGNKKTDIHIRFHKITRSNYLTHQKRRFQESIFTIQAESLTIEGVPIRFWEYFYLMIYIILSICKVT